MISVTKLLLNSEYYGDKLRYVNEARGTQHGTTHGMGPVVVWNCTKTCNLNCIHCYSSSDNKKYDGELTTVDAKKFIDDLADFNVPVILFSGGEPLVRADLLELAAYAKSKGIRSTISTNGTLITPEIAQRIKDIGISYVGISLDGIGDNNDRFRGQKGAFEKALQGIRNCISVGQKVGLRFTINRHNFMELDNIFKLVEKENIPRICFYHLVYSGRANEMIKEDISHEETRQVMDKIIYWTNDFHKRGIPKEILTVDNHCDGIYIYETLKNKDTEHAQRVLELLETNGGNRSGIAIGQVDMYGNVHSDQFTQNHTFGNIKERKFTDIWTDESHHILGGLKNRKSLLKGRCGICSKVNMCNGNFRARAEAVTGDFWETDPACYLTDEEIGLHA
ncbi:MAG: radical SAM protein [Desulfitibacter sp. BRH_c19]|nr:MAG: radical SAM protein [Desulfitibacter sp. BRH_c19]